jgi:hypothetical protein
LARDGPKVVAGSNKLIEVVHPKKIVDDKTLRAALQKKGSEFASKLFDKAAEQGAKHAFDIPMVGLATALGGPPAGAAAGAVAASGAIKAFGDTLFDK